MADDTPRTAPRTAAGRALDAILRTDRDDPSWIDARQAILAIEAEARREGWDAALAAVRAEYGECRQDDPDDLICLTHSEMLFDGHCEDGPPAILDRLASEGPR